MFFDTTDGTGAKSYPLMNRASLYEGANPNFLLSPTNAEAIKRYLYFKWTNNADTNWAYEPGASVTQTWPLPENLKVTNTTLRTAALGGYPLGDLYHWDKTRYNSWKAQAETERRRIDQWLATGVDPGPLSVEQQPGIPTAFTLGQNYPNPFNPGTKIDYSLPQSGHVSLKVYDLLGREVATLFDGEQVAGNYTATFDGAKLASGVYLYRLQSGTSSVAKKLVLMK
jgi:hypothetical protein